VYVVFDVVPVYAGDSQAKTVCIERRLHNNLMLSPSIISALLVHVVKGCTENHPAAVDGYKLCSVVEAATMGSQVHERFEPVFVFGKPFFVPRRLFTILNGE
jgi:hypothetical protein